MDSPHSHPRRRYLNNTHPSLTPLQPVPQNVSTSATPIHALKKSATFHSPTSPSREDDPILSIPSLPRRSPTCAKDLEDILAAAADNGRIAQILGAVDRSLSGLGTFSSDSQETLVAEGLPVPRFMLDAHLSDPDDMETDEPINLPGQPRLHRFTRRHHASDSGIGSTVSSEAMSGDYAGMKQDAATGIESSLDDGRVQTGINGLNLVASASNSGVQHALSEYACRQIQKHIILPILREERLKDFHPLVGGIPYRVARKEITCLRDLEKVLLWLAPKRSVSKASFLNFCETSIQCIHTTIDYLNDRDQRRPTDRPYTNGYFLDLVEQVRQYATMLTETRARMASESNPEASEQSSSEERLGLVGGLSQTGRPVELVRIKDGRSVSLQTGEEVSTDSYKQGTKRSASEESDDDDVLRSMARRRKNALPVVKEAQKCSDCDKVFKRPCDLTKHEKTHSRPWKCSEVGCKYHDYGWPTEKERDRHVNDKHSATPSLYKCQYHPCPYESKRESNCKQHMEKAHGWVYVRSKNNGKVGKKLPSGRTPPTPQMSTPGSHIFNAPTPDFRDSTASYQTSPINRHAESINGSTVASELSAPYTDDQEMAFNDTFGPFDPNFTWNESGNGYDSGSATEYTNTSSRPSWDSNTMTTAPIEPSVFETSLPLHEEESLFGPNFDWSNMDHDLTSLNIQLITPAMSAETRPLDGFSRNPSLSMDEPLSAQIPSLSPGASGDAMLYSPYSMHSNDVHTDEGYGDYTQELCKPTRDFSLFDGSNTTSTMTSECMFQDLSTFGLPSAWSGRGTDLARQLDMSDLMHMDE